MTIRLLHTADWQLGKPFGHVPGDAGAVLREARFEAARTIARLASEHRVDAVLVAGDIFDSNEVAARTVARGLEAMRGFAGPWVLLPGNHDAALAASVWTRIAQAAPSPNLRLATEPQPILLAGDRLAVLPAPLRARRTSEDLTDWMDRAYSPSAAVRVGLAHGAVSGRLPDAAEAMNPIAADRALRARLDYLALGDWHGCQEVGPRTWYSGTPEPDRFPVNDPGWALLVEIEAPGALPRVQRMRTAQHTWSTAEIDLAGAAASDVRARLERALDLAGARERAVLRLVLRGRLSLSARAALDCALADLADSLCHLDRDDGELRPEPDEADLLALAGASATGEVARRLLARGDPVAHLALRHLYALARGA